jgi:hypothetical protein
MMGFPLLRSDASLSGSGSSVSAAPSSVSITRTLDWPGGSGNDRRCAVTTSPKRPREDMG